MCALRCCVAVSVSGIPTGQAPIIIGPEQDMNAVQSFMQNISPAVLILRGFAPHGVPVETSRPRQRAVRNPAMPMNDSGMQKAGCRQPSCTESRCRNRHHGSNHVSLQLKQCLHPICNPDKGSLIEMRELDESKFTTEAPTGCNTCAALMPAHKTRHHASLKSKPG